MADLLVATFYKFVRLPDAESVRDHLQVQCEKNGLCGTVLLAEEGINGTLAGPEAGLRSFLSELRRDPRLTDLDVKESWSAEPPFKRLKVRIKPEIVTMGVPEVDPPSQAGTYVEPRDWNALISDPSVRVVDTRNDYEVEIGTFEGAVDPRIESFGQLPEWADQELLNESSGDRPEKVAMFCTGGIRCEKSTAYLRARGFDQVFHLKGGILRYLEEIPEEESLWRGQCFVFDERVSVGHGLKQGSYTLCPNCGRAVADQACVCATSEGDSAASTGG